MGGGQFKDDRLWYIWQRDPTALGGPPGQPLRLSFPALEQTIVQAALLSAPFGRQLMGEERTILETVFKTGLDIDRIRVVETNVAAAPTTLGNQIRVTPGFSFLTDDGKSTLVHEATHVWQYQTKGTRYISCALVHQVKAMAETGSRNAAYMAYTLDDKRSIFDYPAEEEAMIMEDYYQLTWRYPAAAKNPPSWVAQRRPDYARYERLVKQVQNSTPMSQEQVYQNSLMQPPRQDMFNMPSDPMQRYVPLVPLLRVEF